MRFAAVVFALALLACSSSPDHETPIRNAPEARATKQAPPAPTTPAPRTAAEVPRAQHIFDLRTTSAREVHQLPHGIEDVVAPEAIGRRVSILRALKLDAEGMTPAWVIAYLTPPPPARHPCAEGEENLDDEPRSGGNPACGVLSLAYVESASPGMRRVHNEQLDDDFCRNNEESYGQISVGQPASDPDFAFMLSVSDIDGDARNEVVAETAHSTHSVCPTGSGATEKYAMLDLATFQHELFVTKRVASGGMTGAIEAFQDVHVALRDVDGDGRKDFVMRRTMTSEGVASDCGEVRARIAHSEGEYINIVNSGDTEDGEIPCARYEERTVRYYNVANDTFAEPVPYPTRGAQGAE